MDRNLHVLQVMFAQDQILGLNINESLIQFLIMEVTLMQLKAKFKAMDRFKVLFRCIKIF